MPPFGQGNRSCMARMPINTGHLTKTDLAFLIGITNVLGFNYRNLWTPLVLTNSLFQTFSRWSLNVKTKTTWFDCHTNRSNKHFLSLSITFFLVIVLLQFLRIETLWYQISYYPLFVGSQRGPSSFYGSWLIRMVSRRASLIQSQKYQLLKVVNNCYYKNVEPTLPILTDVHHDICGRTSNRSLAGKPLKVATLTHTRD